MVEYEEPTPEAENTPIGRNVIKWMTRNGIRANKGTIADEIVAALKKSPGLRDNEKMWIEALESMSDDSCFELQLEAKNRKIEFEAKVAKAKRSRAIEKLHESKAFKGHLNEEAESPVRPVPRPGLLAAHLGAELPLTCV